VATISVSRDVPADHERVWTALADLAAHVDWMKDAKNLTFISAETSGVGAKMRVATVVGPFRTDDVIEVTDWIEGEMIGVAHRGLVKGTGQLSAVPLSVGTRIKWVEDLSFPWWLGGPVTAWVSKPILARMWKGNLQRLEATLTSP
jgi:hypothetical protein